MTDKTCKTCAYWGHYRDGDCDAVDRHETGSHAFTIWAKVLDDSGLSTGLKTGPDFGCVLHLPKRKG